MPVFSPGSEWLLPTEMLPAAAAADGDAPPPVLAAADGAVPELAAGAVLAAGEHAAIRLGTAARPATPAIPPRTRRRVMSGLLGDAPSGERGASGFAMISSSGSTPHGDDPCGRTNTDRIARIVGAPRRWCQDATAVRVRSR